MVIPLHAKLPKNENLQREIGASPERSCNDESEQGDAAVLNWDW